MEKTINETNIIMNPELITQLEPGDIIGGFYNDGSGGNAVVLSVKNERIIEYIDHFRSLGEIDVYAIKDFLQYDPLTKVSIMRRVELLHKKGTPHQKAFVRLLLEHKDKNSVIRSYKEILESYLT